MRSRAPDGARSGHRALPHPADLILRAWAPTPEACITEAVEALVDGFADTTGVRARTTYAFEVDAAPWSELVVSVLEEVLFLLDARGVVPLAAAVDSASDGALSVSFTLAAVDEVELVGSTPKGIARSGLEFGRAGDGWRCTVIVDV